jgi:hypothetical protein
MLGGDTAGLWGARLPLFRPPDVQRRGGLVTRGQRALASRDASAYDLANRVFDAARPYFGQRTPMPLVYFRSRTPGARPALDLNAEPAVPIAEAWSRHDPHGAPSGLVAYPYLFDPENVRVRRPLNYLSTPGRLGRVRKQVFADILLHELAHTQQPARYSSRLKVEGGADAFAQLARDYVARRVGLGRRAPFPYRSSYGTLGSRFVSRFGGNQALFGQFGRRYGGPG